MIIQINSYKTKEELTTLIIKAIQKGESYIKIPLDKTNNRNMVISQIDKDFDINICYMEETSTDIIYSGTESFNPDQIITAVYNCVQRYFSTEPNKTIREQQKYNTRNMQEVEKHSKNFPCGMTVKELKELIKDWPETNQYGEDTLVYISTESDTDCTVHSSWCSSVRTNDNGTLVYDLTLDTEQR